MKFSKKISSLVLAASVMTSFAFFTHNAYAGDKVKINVVSFNDFHGAMLSTSEEDKNIGAAKFVTAVKEEKEKNKNTIVLSMGDNFNGSALSNLLHGKPVTDMFKLIGLDGSVIGNHEFDWSLNLLNTWSEDMGAPFLSANIYDKETNEIPSWATPYIIKNIDGVKIGFIGLTTQETTIKSLPSNVNKFEFRNPTEVAEEYVKKLKDDGVNIIVLISHISSFQDPETGEVTLEAGAEGLPYIKGVDAIITGHSHQYVNGEINNIPITQAIYYGRGLGDLEIVYDKDEDKIVSKTAKVDKLYEKKSELSDDPTMVSILNEQMKQIKPIFEQHLAVLSNGLYHDRHKQEVSSLGKWLTEKMMEYGKADLAFMNSGGIRSNIEAGDVTMESIYNIMPFDNKLSVHEMTGEQIKKVFEHGLFNTTVGHIQYSGVYVEYNPENPENNRVTKMILDNGEVIEPNKVYRVAANDFLAEGGDGFDAFKESKNLGYLIELRDLIKDAFVKEGNVNFTFNSDVIGSEGSYDLKNKEKTTEKTDEKMSEDNLDKLLKNAEKDFDKLEQNINENENYNKDNIIADIDNILNSIQNYLDLAHKVVKNDNNKNLEESIVYFDSLYKKLTSAKKFLLANDKDNFVKVIESMYDVNDELVS